ncbi:MAG TPA: D-TA family PLP-dependent enzyme [Chitinophagaceae bacterium]|nr:D-TA family PLP-dependent enzyme [Chitinophagaceae bacterium]
MDTTWYALRHPDTVDSPALLVYPDRVRENIRLAVAMAGGPQRLRPHVKTCKAAEPVAMMREAGITRFKCATIAEAELLGQCGAPDVLLAYQPVGPKIRRLAALIRRYPDTRFSCLADDPLAARELSREFSALSLRVPVYLDLNLGMNRTGIAPGSQAVQLYTLLASLPGLEPAGLHAYDGHLRDRDLAVRQARCEALFSQVLDLQRELLGRGLPVPGLVAGGSPTFPIHAQHPDRECSPGTFVYWDHGYTELCPEQAFQPAALLLTRVISLPAPDRVCLDLGHKSVAAENELERRVRLLGSGAEAEAGTWRPVSQSEEHLVLEAPVGHGCRVGDVLYGIPYHICPTVALYERAMAVQNGEVTATWRTLARDRQLST